MTSGILAISGLGPANAESRIRTAAELIPWRGSLKRTGRAAAWSVGLLGSAEVAQSENVLVAVQRPPGGIDPVGLCSGIEERGVLGLVDVRSAHAAVVFDSRTGAAHLSRDLIGSRSLYWGRCNGIMAVSSDPLAIQILLGRPLREDPSVTGGYLNRRRPDLRSSPFADAHAIAPDSVTTISEQMIERVRRFEALAPVSDPDAAARVRDALATSIRRNTEDLPAVICNASAGLDSSAVAAVASIEGRSKHFVTQFVRGLADDETVRAAELARLHDAQHDVVVIEPSDVIDRTIENIRALGLPHPTAWLSGSTIEHASRVGADVILPGHLGDEWLTMAGGSLAQSLRDREWKASLAFLREHRSETTFSLGQTAGMAAKQIGLGVLVGSYAGHSREATRTNSWMQRTVTSLEQFGAIFGVRVELPFADRDVVEAMLGCRSSQRNEPGRPKTILRKAISDGLPASYREDPVKANFIDVPGLALNDGSSGVESYGRLREIFLDAWRSDLATLERQR